MNDEMMMSQALDICKEGLAKGEAPFGAIVVEKGQVIASAHNTVRCDFDPSAHAEINVIRAAARARKSTTLEGCTLYTTCEPCPMCMAAIDWCQIERVVYGATIGDATEAGLHQIPLDAAHYLRLTGSPVKVEPGPLREPCRQLLVDWMRK